MRFTMWGMTGTLVTEYASDQAHGEERLWHWLDAFDATCNRFRSDSELSRLNAQSGRAVVVSDTLERALEAAVLAGQVSSGLCDPTVLPALERLGYDRDFDEVTSLARAESPVSSPGLSAITIDRATHTVTLAPSCRLDLGASAKALVVDTVADELAALGGVVVELGGDVAVRGQGPDGPWVVGIADRLTLTGHEPRVYAAGSIATSSLTIRTWRVGDETANHIIDPRTGSWARGPYATATVSASNCVIANAFATAALLWGEDAGWHIAQAGWSARLVRHDGAVDCVGGWPRDEESLACSL